LEDYIEKKNNYSVDRDLILINYINSKTISAIMKDETAMSLISHPYDLALINNDPGKLIETTILKLRILSDKFVDGAFALKITLNTNL